MTDVSCSAASLDVDEQLAGTAVEGVDTWMLLEYTRPWAPKPLEPSELPDDVKEHLGQWLATHATARHQFIRRPASDSKTLFVAHARPEASWLLRFDLRSYEELLDLDLDAIVRTGGHPNAIAMPRPVHFVCAHGRRDRCCGLKGSALFREMIGKDVEVWQTSHLGGHRFAACVLTLPEGIYYGRLGEEHAEALIAAHRDGKLMDLDHVRGRCAWDRTTQAAEVFLRRRLGERSLGALRWIDTTPTGADQWTVRFDAAGRTHSVTVRLERLAAKRPESCGGSPEPFVRFTEARH